MNEDLLTLDAFTARMAASFDDVRPNKHIAVGVSGGPDSSALVFLLSQWADTLSGPTIHALIVDHGLRSGSEQEAKETYDLLKNSPYIIPRILVWNTPKPEKAIQEKARNARYMLMSEYCASHNINHLFLGHHLDDQIETFFFRLSKGSGLDGLTCMDTRRFYSDTHEDLILCRPFLEYPKASIIDFCKRHDIHYVEDPSNSSKTFARSRFRDSFHVLQDEGLTPERLHNTILRLSRAQNALDLIAQDHFKKCTLEINSKQLVFDPKLLFSNPEDVSLRVIIMGMNCIGPSRPYPARLSRVEILHKDLRMAALGELPFKKRTLGGVVFEYAPPSKAGKRSLILTTENA